MSKQLITDSELLARKIAGQSPTEIAEAIGKKKNYVYNRFSKMKKAKPTLPSSLNPLTEALEQIELTAAEEDEAIANALRSKRNRMLREATGKLKR